MHYTYDAVTRRYVPVAGSGLPVIRLSGGSSHDQGYVAALNAQLSRDPALLAEYQRYQNEGISLTFISNRFATSRSGVRVEASRSYAAVVWPGMERGGSFQDNPDASFEIEMFVSAGRMVAEGARDLYEMMTRNTAHEIGHPRLGTHTWDGRSTPPTFQEVRDDLTYHWDWQRRIAEGVGVRVGAGSASGFAEDTYVMTQQAFNIWQAANPGVVVDVEIVSESKFFDIMTERVHPQLLGGTGASSVEIVYVVRDAEIIPVAVSRRYYNSYYYSQLGSVVGSSLGDYLANGNLARGIVYSSLLGEVGERLGAALAGGSNLEAAIDGARGGALQQFGSQVAVRAGQAAIGSVSSWLTMELGEALGVKGFGAELFTTVGSKVTERIVGNLLNAALGPNELWNGFVLKSPANASGAGAPLGTAIWGAVGSFLGAKLGAMIVTPQTQAAMALSSIGSAAGGFLALQGIGIIGSAAAAASTAAANLAAGLFGNRVGAWVGNAVLPGVGAFIGFVLGGLIGNLFGRKKPKTPTANAEVYLDYTSDQFQLGASSAANGGNLQLVRDMATSARDTLNGFLTVLAGDMPYDATSWGRGLWRNGKYIASEAGLQSFYGHTGGQLWVKTGSPTATQQNVASADDAVSKGVMWSIKQTQVIGGDIFAKRALANSAATDLTALLGDLQIASDYRFYAENRELINGYITGAYNSLTEAEKTYYASNKALIDKAHTEGVDALTTAQKTTYNANKARIDKIILALEDQAIANPWIITLQRINELKLDQWARSDFYGGMQGFLTSLGVTAMGARFEDLRVYQVSGGMQMMFGTQVPDGVFSLLPQARTNGRSLTVAAGTLATIGYTRLTSGNTSSNDFVDFTGVQTAVNWSDFSQETHTEFVWDERLYEYVEETTIVTRTGGDDAWTIPLQRINALEPEAANDDTPALARIA